MSGPCWWSRTGGQREGESAYACSGDAPTSELTFWERSSGSKIITAFKVKWSDGRESATYGYTPGATIKVVRLVYGEFFKSLTQYWTMEGKNRSFSGWKGTTNLGRVVNVGYTWGDARANEITTLYSGLCVGFGASLDKKQALLNVGGVFFLRNIQLAAIKMNYLTLPTVEIQPVLVDNTTDENDREAPLEVPWSKTVELTNKVTTSKTFVEELGVPTVVLSKGFGINPKDTTNCMDTEDISNSTSYLTTTSTELSRPYEVPAGRTYQRTVVYSRGTFRVQFRPQYTFTLRSGATVNWPEGPVQDAFGVVSGNLHDILSVAVDSPCETPHLHLQLYMHSYNPDTADLRVYCVRSAVYLNR
ncbi:hypothetical protein ANOM_005881 [Aspergillus nomiae NRRL 13137]|uniref:Jacalin-type lectin domain-containing protein n=1 Tax=Aspergillus nomiae NRRL (strain ATCC 15546 / NRRL 13137 / CBS 260.88 / M93) TaxID=1509407 RepID=A0A0L1J4X4_ASPN3|nr:uncharacterized protein ANOM_005881 [Aspergillus nomiae NRRL 13137]KNG86735.1 hypothetical protein ANOM_005881 [Aspergillus nomiae NRRL 13137]